MSGKLSEKQKREILKGVGVSVSEQKHIESYWQRTKNKSQVKSTLSEHQQKIMEAFFGNK